MPTYEYRCKTCGNQWEEYRSIADRHIPESEPCQYCEQKTVGKIESAGHVISGYNLRAKVPAGFKEVINKIKKAHPGNKIDGDLS